MQLAQTSGLGRFPWPGTIVTIVDIRSAWVGRGHHGLGSFPHAENGRFPGFTDNNFKGILLNTGSFGTYGLKKNKRGPRRKREAPSLNTLNYD